MEASGAQAKILPVRVTVAGRPHDAEAHVVASGDRVEFSAPGVPVHASVSRADLLVALGVTADELPGAEPPPAG